MLVDYYTIADRMGKIADGIDPEIFDVKILVVYS